MLGQDLTAHFRAFGTVFCAPGIGDYLPLAAWDLKPLC